MTRKARRRGATRLLNVDLELVTTRDIGALLESWSTARGRLAGALRDQRALQHVSFLPSANCPFRRPTASVRTTGPSS